MPLMGDPSGLIEQVIDRWLDDAVNLGGIRDQFIRSINPGHDRHDESRAIASRYRRKPAEDLDDILPREPYFLPCLSFRGRDGIFAIFPTTPREHDVSGVGPHVLGTSREDDPVYSFCVLIQGNEHGVACRRW